MYFTNADEIDIAPEEAYEKVMSELHRHIHTGRKNFVTRVPSSMLSYLSSAILKSSGMSKSGLERELTELDLYGFRDAEGRTARRYLNGEVRMSWQTLMRLLGWALAKQWIRPATFLTLFFRITEQHAAQLTARSLLNQAKRLSTPIQTEPEHVTKIFYQTYSTLLQEQEELAKAQITRDLEAKHFADSHNLIV